MKHLVFIVTLILLPEMSGAASIGRFADPNYSSCNLEMLDATGAFIEVRVSPRLVRRATPVGELSCGRSMSQG